MTSEAQKRANKKYSMSEKGKAAKSRYGKKYYLKNREKFLIMFAKYRAENKEKLAAKAKEWYEKNKAKVAQYYQDNKEKKDAYHAEYVLKNRERINQNRRKNK